MQTLYPTLSDFADDFFVMELDIFAGKVKRLDTSYLFWERDAMKERESMNKLTIAINMHLSLT